MMHNRYVCGFLFSENGTLVWLIRKNRPQWQAGRLNGIGGHIEVDETPEQAMTREFEEEAGSRIEDWERILILTGPGFEVSFFRSFVKGDWAKFADSANTKTDEEVVFAPVHSIPSDALPNLKWIIPMMLDDDILIPVHMSYK